MNAGVRHFDQSVCFLFFLRSILFLLLLFIGTGSGPYPPNGLQRNTRHTASPEPRMTPHSSIASMAYWEQVG